MAGEKLILSTIDSKSESENEPDGKIVKVGRKWHDSCPEYSLYRSGAATKAVESSYTLKTDSY
jgi:hypothetical protein